MLVFSAIPDQDEARLMQRFGKAANYLSEQLDIEVRYVPVKSYAAAVTAFRNNEVQLAWFGGLSGVQATQLVPGSRAIAQGAEDPQYVSYFIAYRDTGIIPSADFPTGLEGRSFTFGSKSSTSGRLMPEFFLREQFGKSPEEIFSRVGFSGDHSTTIALVQSGAYELGALSYQVWDKEVADGTVDTDKVQVIWTTPPYPITTGSFAPMWMPRSVTALPTPSNALCWSSTTGRCWMRSRGRNLSRQATRISSRFSILHAASA